MDWMQRQQLVIAWLHGMNCHAPGMSSRLRRTKISTLLQACAPSDNWIHIELLIGGATMEFLESTRSEVFAE
jgi:hypothetical protein